jgi:group I intron endonuclease
MENNYSVYLHTTPSEKVYVGITNQRINHRWGKDGNNYKKQAFGRAVNKYGWDNIQHEVLFVGLTLEEAEAKEKELIAKYRANDRRYGYNCTDGGGVCHYNDDTKKRISDSLTGRKLTEEHKKNIGNGSRGRAVSDETRRKIGDKHRNKTVSDEAREHLREAHQWQAKPVVQMTLDGKEIAWFRSIGEAARSVGGKKVCIRHACDGKIKTSCGYKWRYAESVVKNQDERQQV